MIFSLSSLYKIIGQNGPCLAHREPDSLVG